MLLVLFVSLLIMAVFLLVAGANPLAVYGSMLSGAFGSKYAFSETVVKAIPLTLCALAVALPARTGFINIGGEGQMIMGAIGATLVALFVPWLQGWAMIPTMMLFSMIFAMLWAAIPALLKAYVQVNEIIVTLLLNYVAAFLLQYLVHGPWKDPSSQGWPLSAEFPASAILPTIPGTRVHLMLLIGVVVAIILAIVAARTTWGFAIKIIEANPRAAAYAGINIPLYTFAILCIGGALAGLAGLGEVSAIQGRLRDGLTSGYGYTGFLVAWLSRNNFLLIPLVALLLGGILAGGDNLQITANLPSATAEILQSIIFLGVLMSEYWRTRTDR